MVATTFASCSTASVNLGNSRTASSSARPRCGAPTHHSSRPCTTRPIGTDVRSLTSMVGNKARPPTTCYATSPSIRRVPARRFASSTNEILHSASDAPASDPSSFRLAAREEGYVAMGPEARLRSSFPNPSPARWHLDMAATSGSVSSSRPEFGFIRFPP